MIEPHGLLALLDGVKGRGGSYMAKCPAHDDSSPSLAIRFTGDRVLLHCFAGCETQHVVEAMGLTLGDLMPEEAGEHRKGLQDRFSAAQLMAVCAHDLLIASIICNDASAGRVVSVENLNTLAKIAGKLSNAADLSIRGRLR